MCETKWKNIVVDEETVDRLQSSLAVCLGRGLPHSLLLCQNVLDHLLREQMPIDQMEMVIKSPSKPQRGVVTRNEAFLMWILGEESAPDYVSLAVMISTLHQKTYDFDARFC